jgi:hypothetical protein
MVMTPASNTQLRGRGPGSRPVDLANLTGPILGVVIAQAHRGIGRIHRTWPTRSCGTPALSVLMIMFNCCRRVVAMAGKSLSPLWILKA